MATSVKITTLVKSMADTIRADSFHIFEPWYLLALFYSTKEEGVSLLIDPTSIQYLTGAEIDYSEGLEGSQFVIRNPNAATTCGCGSSFSV